MSVLIDKVFKEEIPLLFRFNIVDNQTTLSVEGTIDQRDITVTDPTGFVIGNFVTIFSTVLNKFSFYTITGVAGSVITLDTPLDANYPIGSFVTNGRDNMNVNGSVTPVKFALRNTNERIERGFNMHRLIIVMETATAPNLGDFGDIAGGLTNGVVFRKTDGEYVNYFNIKTNGDIAELAYDLDFLAAGGGGQDGLKSRLTFNGDDKMGVVISITDTEDLEMIIQDDLTTLQSFKIFAQGHIRER